MPRASRTRTASNVARARPPAWPRVAMDRMKTPGSTPVSAIRIRSSRTAPPVYGDVGSTATTPTFLPRARYARTRRLTRDRTESRDRRDGALRAGLDSPTLCGRLEELDDVAERSPGAEDLLNPRLLQPWDILLGNDAAAGDHNVSCPAFLQEFHDLREQGHVRPAQAREANRVDILLDRGLDDVLRRLPQSRVDDLHPRIAERAGDDLRPAVMAIQAGLRDEDAYLLRHADTSVEQRLLPDTKGLSHHVADLAEGRLRLHALQDVWHRDRKSTRLNSSH